MNIRKPVDYGTMYRELTAILTQNLPQMDEVYAIGKGISQRPEKGAAVAAAEYLQANFPDRVGFSPRNVRRMRDFYKTYENDQALLQLAMKIGWTLNVLIMEAKLSRLQKRFYIYKAMTEKLSKKLLEMEITDKKRTVDDSGAMCYNHYVSLQNYHERIEHVMPMTVNIAGQVRQIRLSTAKALWPLFETVINSIQSLEDTIYDIRKELVVNIEHMIVDNKPRFPEPFNTMPDYQLKLYIDGCVKAAIERVKRNYKVAIPQYFLTTGTIQLLIPLCLSNPNVADLAIVVEDYGSMYRASTCLTLDMAMNNARLLARPDRDWLNP